MKRSATLLAVLVASGALVLSGCSNDSETPDTNQSQPAPAPSQDTAPEPTEPAPEPTEDTEPAPEPTDDAAAENASDDAVATDDGDDAAPGGLQQFKASSETGEDPGRGDTATVTGVAFGFVGTGDWAEAPGDNVYVGVEYHVSHGDKYYGGVNCNSLGLSTPESSRPASSMTSSVKDDMAAAGLTPLDDIETGGEATGWCMYYVPAPTQSNLTVTYDRGEAKAGDEVIEEYVKELPITVG